MLLHVAKRFLNEWATNTFGGRVANAIAASLVIVPNILLANGGDPPSGINFSLSGICAPWMILKGPDFNEPLKHQDCTSFGEHLSVGDCTLDLEDGDYRLILSAINPNWHFTVRNGHLGTPEILLDGPDDEYTLKTNGSDLTVRSRLFQIHRNGYRGYIGFEHQHEIKDKCEHFKQDAEKRAEIKVPVGANIRLGYNWMGLNHFHNLKYGQLSTLTRIGFEGSPFAQERRMTHQTTNSGNPYMRLFPVKVTVTPDADQMDRWWTIVSAFEPIPFDGTRRQYGEKDVMLLPGTNFTLWVERDNDPEPEIGHFYFNYDTCEIGAFESNPNSRYLDMFEFTVSSDRNQFLCRMSSYTVSR